MKSALGEIANFSNGKKKPHETGNIPVYGGNGVFAYSNKSNAENCAIIGRVGAYCGSTYYEPEECWISDNAIRCEAKAGNDIQFIYYLLKCLHLDKQQIGTSQPLLTQGVLNSIEIENVPKLNIQKKIAVVLSSIDLKIEITNRINGYLAA